MKKRLIISVIAILALAGCSTKTEYVNDGVGIKASKYSSMGIDSADFEYAAQQAVNSLLRSGALNRPGGGRYVISMGNIINDTTQRIDTDLLTKKIRVALLQSGKAVMTTATSENGPEDETTYIVRDKRNNDEFNQDTIAKKGTLLAPDMSISGKIIQRNAGLDKKRQIVDYYFLLTLTDINSGLAFWENESKITKVGSNKSVIW
ncbi:penicillin-binding protein activator LpoB [Campylobacter corcagiensis]|uniref:Penicillin-binding protein activator LpoB n=1 Tax=Campylobacter corcagiensis TaxID=1448857 RepID=A0A7M1LDQ1_9BACT|nr:penicillin-binding protein activator LpoB [Campylobacter corcagiensis]QKF65155.1 outer membrane lipoprotein, putative peptidoglycan-synthase activator LpoB [Campylobacter corcagiensis]QOQ86702.1 penicillin-binding protein activator LpoB [Campylobacter corcagiensis]